jgi:ankyrin repeat protein
MVTMTRSLLLAGLTALLLGCGPAPANDAAVSAAAVEVDPDYRHPDDSTELMWAVYDGDAEKAAALIAAGADVDASNRYGSNAMQLAAEVANVEMLTMLLDAGADVDSPSPEGQTALMLVARTGDMDAARLLVEHGAAIDAREQWGGQTALMWASARRHPEMVEYLAELGADVDARSKWRDYQRHITAESRAKNMDTGGLTPLMYAIRENCIACVDVLIARGADVDLPDPDRVSPLLLSIINSNWDISKRLIEAGADVDQWDIYGQTPLHAIATRRDNTARTSIDPLNVTTGDEILRMILDRGAETNLQLFTRAADQRGGGNSRGATPLHAAASSGDLEAVRLLIEHGADVNLNDTDNETALMLAVGGGGGFFGGGGAAGRATPQIVRLLCEQGADVDANALYHHLQRTRGGTALHYAVRSGNGAAIDALVECGADVDIMDPDGLTALDYALAHGYIPFLQMRQPPRMDLVEKLRGHGATVALAEEPYWAPVGPPIGYEATIWPLGPAFPSRTLEDLQPSPDLVAKVDALRYGGTPQPQPTTTDVAQNTQ